jgi:hypothetical protein
LREKRLPSPRAGLKILKEGVAKLVCAKCGIIGKNADFQFLFQKCAFLEDAKSLEIQEIFHPSTTLDAKCYNFLQFVQQRQRFAANFVTPSVGIPECSGKCG